MAASTCTTQTGAITETDPNFVLTRTVKNRKDGIFLYIKLAFAGTTSAVTIVCKTINERLSATDQYNIVQASGAVLSPLTYILSAAGNYKIPLALSQHDDKVVLTITPNTTGGDATITANVMEA
jgi:hypothetical protein